MLERRLVLYSGRVQGVGFRYTTCHVARRYQVTGWVKNLPDGRVELVAEGEANELDRFFSAVEEAMGSTISGRQIEVQSPQGSLDGFSIR